VLCSYRVIRCCSVVQVALASFLYCCDGLVNFLFCFGVFVLFQIGSFVLLPTVYLLWCHCFCVCRYVDSCFLFFSHPFLAFTIYSVVCLIDPNISFFSNDMCCISREFIFYFAYLLCSLYLVSSKLPVWSIYILLRFPALVCRCLRLLVLCLVVFLLTRVCIAAGFENNVYLVLALLHLPVDVNVANCSCCILFFLLVVSRVCHCLCFCLNFVVQFLTLMLLFSYSAPCLVLCVILFLLFSSPLAKCCDVGGARVQ